MNKSNKWMFLIFITLVLLALGFLKDFIFININTHLFYVKRNLEDVRSHTFFNFLNSFSFKTVYYLKYLFTVLFLSANYVCSLMVLKILNKRSLIKFLNIIYLGVSFLAILFFVGGFIIDKAETGYAISRVLIGPIESPLPLIFLIIASKINNNQQLQ